MVKTMNEFPNNTSKVFCRDSTIDLSVFREGVKPYEDEGIMDRKIKKNNEDVIPYFSCFWIIKMNRRIL